MEMKQEMIREVTAPEGRNRNVDILRAFALLWMMAYHAWVQCGASPFRFEVLNVIIHVGGEMGVTGFFLLSGYGIYCSLSRSEAQGKISFLSFMKKRLKRIAPQYYLALIVALLFTSSVMYLQPAQLWNIVTHVFFIHNWFLDYFGAINGVLWTMGVIFQFYVIAIPLYKLVSRGGILVGIGSILFTVGCKIAAYAWLIPALHSDRSLQFFMGRQLPTALDNFVIGMVVAYVIYNKKKRIPAAAGWIGSMAAFVLLLVTAQKGLQYGITRNNISGYLWHSIAAVLLGLILFCFSCVRISYTNVVSRLLLWISDYEYGTYLWHLMMFNNLIAGAPIIVSLLEAGCRKTVYVILMVLALLVGYMFSKVEEGMRHVLKW